jgi:uncharacterized protein (TIGR00255 family)
MAIRSMTGYGRASAEVAGFRLTCEMRSVNHRGLDIRVMAPPALSVHEMSVRQAVKRRCARGRVECRLALAATETAPAGSAALAEATLIYRSLDAVREHLGLVEPVRLSDLVAAGLEPRPSDPAEPLDELGDAVLDLVDRALTRLLEARMAEGGALQQEFRAQLARLGGHLDRIEALRQAQSNAHRDRLRRRLDEVLELLGAAGGVERDRLLQEVAIYLDRSDIAEEVARAKSHVETLSELFSPSLPPDPDTVRSVGKRIDFFLQELIRETNTMAAKSDSTELTEEIISAKVEVERMREQVQNIE